MERAHTFPTENNLIPASRRSKNEKEQPRDFVGVLRTVLFTLGDRNWVRVSARDQPDPVFLKQRRGGFSGIPAPRKALINQDLTSVCRGPLSIVSFLRGESSQDLAQPTKGRSWKTERIV